MAQIDFPVPDPTDPSTLTVTAAGITWTWNAALQVWSVEPSGSDSTASSVTTSDTAPANPSPGQLWFSSADVNDGGLRLFVRYDNTWVDVSLPTNIP